MAPSLAVLLYRCGLRLYALPLASVREIMRALPASPVPEMPEFLSGLAMIRGAPVPVVDAARLAGVLQPAGPPDDGLAALPAAAGAARAARYIVLALGQRSVALAVDDVLGVRTVATEELAQVAPLLDGVEQGFVQSISTLDHELLLVLRAGRLMPDAMWASLAAGSGA